MKTERAKRKGKEKSRGAYKTERKEMGITRGKEGS